MKFTPNIKTAAHKAGFAILRRSPEILVVSGIIGTVTATVIACRATLKLDDILNESAEKIEKIHNSANDETFSEKYSKKDAQKDLAVVYIQTGVNIVRLYAPAFVVGVSSITAIVYSHSILRKRNIALAAAYATIDQSFKNYRKNVIDRFGERIDKEIKYKFEKQAKEETAEDTDGNEIVRESFVDMPKEEHYIPSEYGGFFDETSRYYKKKHEYNMMFLSSQEKYANELLHIQGYLFLNDVYELIGWNKTKAGQIVGWKYNPKNKDSIGDNYIDFGIQELHPDETQCDILLDFNVDGDILTDFK